MAVLLVSVTPSFLSVGDSQQSEQAISKPSYTVSGSIDDEAYEYRRLHTIYGALGAGTNYPVRITVHAGSGVSSGEHVYLNGHCRTDFADVRFTDTSEQLLTLTYWQDAVLMDNDDRRTTFWVKVAGDLSKDVSIYIYYCDPDAVSGASSGGDVFLFFDHFNAPFDPNKWGHTGEDYPILDGISSVYLFGKPSGPRLGLFSMSYFGPYGISVVTRAACSWGGLVPNTVWGAIANGGDCITQWGDTGNNVIKYVTANNGIQTYSYVEVPNLAPQYRVYEANWGTSDVIHWIDGGEVCHHTQNVPDQAGVVTMCEGTGDPLSFVAVDWVAVRKCVLPEPVQGEWDGEQLSDGRINTQAWKYCKFHTIYGSQGAGTDYQMYFEVYAGAGTDAGPYVFLNNKASRADLGDVRFVNSQGYMMSCWRTNILSGSVGYWVRITEDLNQDCVIRLFYGNPDAQAMSNGYATFPLFFDDFNRYDSNTVGNGWTQDSDTSCVTSISANQLRIYAFEHRYCHIEKAAPSLTNFVVQAKIKADSHAGLSWAPALTVHWNQDDWASAKPVPAYSGFYFDYNKDSTVGSTSVSWDEVDIWCSYRLTVKSSAVSLDWSLDGSNWYPVPPTTRPGTWTGAPDLIILGKGWEDNPSYPYPNMDNNYSQTGTAGTQYADDIFVRKYVEAEPAHGGWSERCWSNGQFDASDWMYWKAHVIKGAIGAGTNYQIPFYGYFASGDDDVLMVYFDSHAKSDFSDVRFVDTNGNSLDYWIQYYADSSSAFFWVEVKDNLGTPTEALDTTIYVYYGNPAAQSRSNGYATFPFFDDFNRADSNTVGNGWTQDSDTSCVTSISANQLRIYALEHRYCHIQKAAPSLANFVVQVKIKAGSYAGLSWAPALTVHWNQDDWASAKPVPAYSKFYLDYNKDSTVGSYGVIGCQANSWYFYRLTVTPSTVSFDWSLNAAPWSLVSSTSRPGTWTGAPDLIILGKGWEDNPTYPGSDMDNRYNPGGTAGTQYADNVFVRKYVYPEPWHGDWGYSAFGVLPLQFGLPDHVQLLNPGFEMDDAPEPPMWERMSGQWQTLYDEDANTGDYSLRLYGSNPCIIQQQLAFPGGLAGTRLEFSYYLKGTTGSANSYGKAVLHIVTGTKTTDIQGSWAVTEEYTPRPWTLATVTALIPSDITGQDKIIVSIEVWRLDGGDVNILVDSGQLVVYQETRMCESLYGYVTLGVDVNEVSTTTTTLVRLSTWLQAECRVPGFYIRELDLSFYMTGGDGGASGGGERNNLNWFVEPHEATRGTQRFLASVAYKAITTCIAVGIGVVSGGAGYGVGMALFDIGVGFFGDLFVDYVISSALADGQTMAVSYDYSGQDPNWVGVSSGGFGAYYDWSDASGHFLRVEGVVHWARVISIDSGYFLCDFDTTTIGTYIQCP